MNLLPHHLPARRHSSTCVNCVSLYPNYVVSKMPASFQLSDYYRYNPDNRTEEITNNGLTTRSLGDVFRTWRQRFCCQVSSLVFVLQEYRDERAIGKRERESAEVEERESYVFDPVRCSTKARLHLTGQFDKAKATSQGRRCAQQDNDEEPGNGNNPVPPSDQDNGSVGSTNVQHAVGG
jgi:hypothetical protein